jgi:hypothetical protein
LRRLVLIGLVTVLLAAAAPVGRAGAAERDTQGPDFLISGPAGVSFEDRPAVAYNTKKQEFLVVWRDLRDFSSSGENIYGRLVSAAGVPLGADFRISDGAGKNGEDRPAVAYNPDADEYLVVWSDSRNDAFLRGTDIFGRRVSAAGVPLRHDFLISGPKALRNDKDPAVAYSPVSLEYLVVWTDYRNFTLRNTDTYGRRVSAAGKGLGPDFRISGPAAKGAESFTAIAYNPDAAEYLVVWGDERRDTDRIYGRRVALDGSRPESEFRVSGGAALAAFPAVAYHPPNHQYLVAWQDERTAATTGKDVYAVRLLQDGERIGVDRRISDGDTYEGGPQVVYSSANGRYLLTWMDENATDGGFDVVGRALSGTGAFAGAVFRINGGDSLSALTTQDAAYDPVAGRCLVVWPDGRTYATTYLDIYGRFATA